MSTPTWDDVKAAGDRYHDLQARHEQQSKELALLADELAQARDAFFAALVQFNTPANLPPTKMNPTSPSGYVCSLCDATFATSQGLGGHRRAMHGIAVNRRGYESPPGDFACDHAGCDRTFATQRALDLHRRRVHRNVEAPAALSPAAPSEPELLPSLACPVQGCESIFSTSIGLERHLLLRHAEPTSELFQDDPPPEVLAEIEVALADPT